jgi:hypothetical protein
MADKAKSPLTEKQKTRIDKANEIYRNVCKEIGIRTFSWQSFDSWKDYVAGNITEAELSEDLRKALQSFTKDPNEYIAKEETETSQFTGERADRAKKANEIYKNVCKELGLNACFFSNFNVWKEFVEGEVDETEFYEKAITEARKTLQ